MLTFNFNLKVGKIFKGFYISFKNIVFSLAKNNLRINIPNNYSELEKINNIFLNTIDYKLPEVIYGLPLYFPDCKSRYKIGFTMFEAQGIPKKWVNLCNLMDELWLPSDFNVNEFKAGGVTTNIAKIPLGVNPTIFNKDVPFGRYSSKFTFLSVFQWSERKNPMPFISYFLKAFDSKDDVILVLKTIGYKKKFNVYKEMKKAGFLNKLGSKIIVDSREILDDLMGSVYRAADCFVFPTSGEGWGMPILEALACGLPVIATDWGGAKEFFNENNGYPIRVKKLVKPPFRFSKLYTNSLWAEPDFEHMVYLMEYIYENIDSVKDKSIRNSQEILDKWNWENTALKIIERLKSFK